MEPVMLELIVDLAAAPLVQLSLHLGHGRNFLPGGIKGIGEQNTVLSAGPFWRYMYKSIQKYKEILEKSPGVVVYNAESN